VVSADRFQQWVRNVTPLQPVSRRGRKMEDKTSRALTEREPIGTMDGVGRNRRIRGPKIGFSDT